MHIMFCYIQVNHSLIRRNKTPSSCFLPIYKSSSMMNYVNRKIFLIASLFGQIFVQLLTPIVYWFLSIIAADIWFCIEDLDSLIIFLHFLRPICFCSTKFEQIPPGVRTRYGGVSINSITCWPVTQSPELSIRWSDQFSKPPVYRVICQNTQTTVSQNNRQYWWLICFSRKMQFQIWVSKTYNWMIMKGSNYANFFKSFQIWVLVGWLVRPRCVGSGVWTHMISRSTEEPGMATWSYPMISCGSPTRSRAHWICQTSQTSYGEVIVDNDPPDHGV